MLAHTSSCNTVTAQLKSDDLDGRNLFPCLRRRRRRRCRHRVCDFGRVPTPALLPPLATHFLDRPRSPLVPPAAGEAAATQLPLSSPEVSHGSVPAITCPAIYRASQKTSMALSNGGSTESSVATSETLDNMKWKYARSVGGGN
uniref:Uncharacterized protein n=1 Tax=Oryza meridionalis TaxID=40149 RepID=A0A0E0ERA6_9ORYZ